MPSYAPPKPPPKRPHRVGKLQPLRLDWRIRTDNAIGAIQALRPAASALPHVADRFDRALAHLRLLDQATTNRAYQEGHRAALREVGLAFGLLSDREKER